MNSSKRRRHSGRMAPYSTQRPERDASPDFTSGQQPTAEQLEVIESLLSKTWHFHHVSPLWKLDTSLAKLRLYSQLLTKHTNDNLEDRIQASNSVDYVAKVTGMPQFGLDGSEALKITVRHKNSTREAPELMAILCRVNASQSLAAEFTSLPLLLLHGPARLSQVAFGWLQSMFDCHISPNKLTAEDLTQLVAAYATATKVGGRGLGSLELVYCLPEPIKKAGLSSISVELAYDSALALWSSTGHVEGHSDRRREFVKALTHHIHDHLHIKLESMALSRISTPVLHAEAEGKLKFSSADCVIPVLSVLQYRHP